MRQEVKNVDVSQLHPNENVIMVFWLIREEGRHIEARHFASRWVRLGHHQLDLTVI